MAPCSSSSGTARSGTSCRTGFRPCGRWSGRSWSWRPSTRGKSSAIRCATAARRNRHRRAMSDAARPLLSVNNIEVIYDHVILVLKGVSIQVPEGGIVALLGANGAGKSTTLKAISGLLRTERGDVTKGSIELLGAPIHRGGPAEVVRHGIVQVMEGRHVFEHLTVEENLLTGAYTRRNGQSTKKDLEVVYHYFPRLIERRSSQAGYISGGEQQMVAIGRALMARPKLMLLDEPSMGLAPMLVKEIFDIVGRLNREE